MTILRRATGTPNSEGMRAVELLASLEGIMLDPVYTGKAMAGLIDGVQKSRFSGSGPLMFYPYRRRPGAVRLLSAGLSLTLCLDAPAALC
ncbi:D-cysteine desulfhydrase [Raoultella terrigena]|uniref:D-cysteine desulfhydrase n=1 Tax=Raoultella terrigena TaxID=577 RepID=A0A4U9CWR8_RAOTE|nr:D-cysteine desulfhydrase [Raoultella terrigena]